MHQTMVKRSAVSTNLPINIGVHSGGVEVYVTVEKSVKLPYREACFGGEYRLAGTRVNTRLENYADKCVDRLKVVASYTGRATTVVKEGAEAPDVVTVGTLEARSRSSC